VRKVVRQSTASGGKGTTSHWTRIDKEQEKGEMYKKWDLLGDEDTTEAAVKEEVIGLISINRVTSRNWPSSSTRH
jgi:hypothetical protein